MVWPLGVFKPRFFIFELLCSHFTHKIYFGRMYYRLNTYYALHILCFGTSVPFSPFLEMSAPKYLRWLTFIYPFYKQGIVLNCIYIYAPIPQFCSPLQYECSDSFLDIFHQHFVFEIIKLLEDYINYRLY